jgi:hypothetical protein
VEQSTGFAAPGSRDREPLPAELQRVADAARSDYDALARHRLVAGRSNTTIEG